MTEQEQLLECFMATLEILVLPFVFSCLECSHIVKPMRQGSKEMKFDVPIRKMKQSGNAQPCLSHIYAPSRTCRKMDPLGQTDAFL